MRYRRLHVRYAMLAPSGQAWPYGDLWAPDRLRILVQASWRPDADLYETATTLEVAVELRAITSGSRGRFSRIEPAPARATRTPPPPRARPAGVTRCAARGPGGGKPG